MSDHDHALQQLLALSPVDGRYASKTAELVPIFSEYALIRKRIQVQAGWLQHLSDQKEIRELPPFTDEDRQWLAQLVTQFSPQDALAVKEIERHTNHDVKACEYFLKERCAQRPGLAPHVSFIHFACTSEDVNNLAYGLMLHEAREQVLLPCMQEIVQTLGEKAANYADQAMLARTHGQAATPTTMGKEVANTGARLKRQLAQFQALTLSGKLNGAVGNYNAHQIAYPDMDWPACCRQFVTSLGLDFNPYTTQIEPHDTLAEYCQVLGRWNNILVDFCRDMWGYISLGYFAQDRPHHETGSSTMPHKINPIDFENAEGNLKLSKALLDFFAETLPVSRWQRDLTGSTLARNIGVSLAHAVVAWQALLQGVGRLRLMPEVMSKDLDAAWEVLAEPIQVLMRRTGDADAYETLKDLTKGHTLDAAAIQKIIEQLNLPEATRAELAKLSPATYTGLAAQLARAFTKASAQ